MAWTVTPDDIEAALGVSFATVTDEEWALTAANGANAYIAATPLASDPAAESRVHAGGTMLAVWLYKRRPMGTVEPGFEFTPTSDEVTAFYMLLGLGRHAPPIVA